MKKIFQFAAAAVVLLLSLSASSADELLFDFRAPDSIDDPKAPSLMRDLAERILPVYEEPDRERYLLNLAALQLVVGDFEAADETREVLRDRRRKIDAGRPLDRGAVYDLYAHARALEAAQQVPFEQTFKQAFGDMAPQLNDHDAYALASALGAPAASFEETLQIQLEDQRHRASITMPDALWLLRGYLAADAYRRFGPLVTALYASEETKRYLADEDVLIHAYPQGGLYAHIVRPKNAPPTLPSLLEFNIDGSNRTAEASAAHGYIGVVAYFRARELRYGRLVPFEHDGAAAKAAIEWIAKQPWSDGRVGMIGDGYSAVAAWAVSRKPPAALKAIATSDSMAPGIDFPMEGRVFRNSAYRWATTETTPGWNAAHEGNDTRWSALDQAWYESGKRYRELDVLDHAPNSAFRRWLNHPSYDSYWQKFIPYRKQFAKIDLPVLTTTGYYADGEVGALYYFTQHLQFDKKADHTLLIGPYGTRRMQDGQATALRGLPIDPVARVDLGELRYQWFDHIFKNGEKPALLQDRVNVQVMGANEWRHASSLDALANGSLKFYLSPSPEGLQLTPEKTDADSQVPQAIDFKDRSDAGWTPPTALNRQRIATPNALTFVSEPLKQTVEFAGLPTGLLDVLPSRQDVDLNLTLYELHTGGSYLQLADPYEFRASYVKDRVHRRLLKVGVRQQLPFTSEQMISRRLQAGSRLVLVLGVNKRPDREINYGSGKDVSEGSIADAKKPLSLRWYGGSYVEIPIRK